MVKLDKVKWGFIGCGEVTEKKSGPAFALIEGSEVVAVMSRDKEKAQSYAKRHNIPRWYSDPQQLIGDEDTSRNLWRPAMKTVHASTAYHRKQEFLVS